MDEFDRQFNNRQTRNNRRGPLPERPLKDNYFCRPVGSLSHRNLGDQLTDQEKTEFKGVMARASREYRHIVNHTWGFLYAHFVHCADPVVNFLNQLPPIIDNNNANNMLNGLELLMVAFDGWGNASIRQAAFREIQYLSYHMING